MCYVFSAINNTSSFKQWDKPDKSTENFFFIQQIKF